MKLSEYLSAYPQDKCTRAGILAGCAYGAAAGAGVCAAFPSPSWVYYGLLVSYIVLAFYLDSIDRKKHLSDLEQGVPA